MVEYFKEKHKVKLEPNQPLLRVNKNKYDE
jgi:hypothetical protein